MRLIILTLIACFALSACAISDRVVYTDAEGVVPESFFSTIKKKKTHENWVTDNLGQPYAVDEEAGVKFLTYHFAKSHYSKMSVLLVLNRGAVEEEEEYYHLMICDNLVERAWFDVYPVVDTHRLSMKSRCYTADS